MIWLLLLTSYLWTAGAYGWNDSYGWREETTAPLNVKALVYAVWPVMTLVSMVLTAKDELEGA